MPVFNDWQPFVRLLELFDGLRDDPTLEIHLIAVDDGSFEAFNPALLSTQAAVLVRCRVVRLACNLGHQRAIATGLVVALREANYDAVAIMDADGEDRPEDLATLIATWRANPSCVVVAKRGARTEGPVFKAFYRL